VLDDGSLLAYISIEALQTCSYSFSKATYSPFVEVPNYFPTNNPTNNVTYDSTSTAKDIGRYLPQSHHCALRTIFHIKGDVLEHVSVMCDVGRCFVLFSSFCQIRFFQKFKGITLSEGFK